MPVWWFLYLPNFHELGHAGGAGVVSLAGPSVFPLRPPTSPLPPELPVPAWRLRGESPEDLTDADARPSPPGL